MYRRRRDRRRNIVTSSRGSDPRERLQLSTQQGKKGGGVEYQTAGEVALIGKENNGS